MIGQYPVGSTGRESGADASQIEWRPSLLLHHLFILAALLVPSVGVLTYVGFELRDRYRAGVDSRLETTAQSLAVAIERAFQRHVGALENLGSSPEFGIADRDGDLGRLYLHASRTADLSDDNSWH